MTRSSQSDGKNDGIVYGMNVLWAYSVGGAFQEMQISNLKDLVPEIVQHVKIPGIYALVIKYVGKYSSVQAVSLCHCNTQTGRIRKLDHVELKDRCSLGLAQRAKVSGSLDARHLQVAIRIHGSVGLFQWIQRIRTRWKQRVKGRGKGRQSNLLLHGLVPLAGVISYLLLVKIYFVTQNKLEKEQWLTIKIGHRFSE